MSGAKHKDENLTGREEKDSGAIPKKRQTRERKQRQRAVKVINRGRHVSNITLRNPRRRILFSNKHEAQTIPQHETGSSKCKTSR